MPLLKAFLIMVIVGFGLAEAINLKRGFTRPIYRIILAVGAGALAYLFLR
jgi:hypothetical protein